MAILFGVVEMCA